MKYYTMVSITRRALFLRIILCQEVSLGVLCIVPVSSIQSKFQSRRSCFTSLYRICFCLEQDSVTQITSTDHPPFSYSPKLPVPLIGLYGGVHITHRGLLNNSLYSKTLRFCVFVKLCRFPQEKSLSS